MLEQILIAKVCNFGGICSSGSMLTRPVSNGAYGAIKASAVSHPARNKTAPGAFVTTPPSEFIP
jgi:hypothetical protein